MRFKNDKNLTRVAAATAAHVAPEIVAVELFRRMVDAGMIDDPEDCWMLPVVKVIGQETITDVCALLSEYLYGCNQSIPADVFDAFCALIVWGDGDCPECGGELELIDAEGHELHDGDYYTPNSYIVDYYIYRCRDCGETVKCK